MQDLQVLLLELEEREQELGKREQWLREKDEKQTEREKMLLRLQQTLNDQHTQLEDQQAALDSYHAQLKDNDERQEKCDAYLRERNQELEELEARLGEHNNALHAHQKKLEIWEDELKEFRAKKYSENLRGLDLCNVSIDELQDLKLTIEEASKRVHEALERREAEEAVAKAENSFCCPIGLDLMTDPVVAADGHTYQREKIQAWFASSQLAGSTFKSPKTNLELDHLMLIPNHALKSVIQDAVDNTIASMRSRERAVSPPAEVDESVGIVRSC